MSRSASESAWTQFYVRWAVWRVDFSAGLQLVGTDWSWTCGRSIRYSGRYCPLSAAEYERDLPQRLTSAKGAGIMRSGRLRAVARGACRPNASASAMRLAMEVLSLRSWKFWLGVVVSIVFLALALRGLDFAGFWTTVRQANYWWLIPGIAVYFAAVWARTWRWHYMLRHIKQHTDAAAVSGGGDRLYGQQCLPGPRRRGVALVYFETARGRAGERVAGDGGAGAAVRWPGDAAVCVCDAAVRAAAERLRPAGIGF